MNVEAGGLSHGRRGAFPQLLWTLLENSTLDPVSGSAIIEWCDDGVAFVIRDGAALEKFVLPQYFKSHRLDSFLRQLSYHDFTQIDFARAESRTKAMRVYTHKTGLFSLQLGEAESVLIQRRRTKKAGMGTGNGHARSSSPLELASR